MKLKYNKTYNTKIIFYSISFFSEVGFANMFQPFKIKYSSMDNGKRSYLENGSTFEYPFGLKTVVSNRNINQYEYNGGSLIEIGKFEEKTQSGEIIHDYEIKRGVCNYTYTYTTDSLIEFIKFRVLFLIKNYRIWKRGYLKK